MDKISKLLSVLMARTDDGLIAWRETVDEDAFQYSLVDSTIGIAEYGGTYSVTIYNETGRIVDIVTDEELDKASGSNAAAAGRNHRELMEHLHAAARRKALQVDTTIDSILMKLGVEA